MMFDDKRQTAREAFGGILRFHRESRGYNLRRVAHIAHVQQSDVEAWEAGRAVPTSREWEHMIQRMHRSLRGFAEQYKAARTEDETERAKITGAIGMINGHSQNGHRASIGTNLGDALNKAIAAPAPIVEFKPGAFTRPIPNITPPEPEPPKETTVAPPTERRGSDGRALPPPVPAGSKTTEAMRLREDFVRKMLRERPAIKYGGSDGLGVLLVQTFGIGVAPNRVNKIRDEVQAERARGAMTLAPVIAAIPKPESVAAAPAEPKATPTPTTTDSELEAAANIVLDAIPGLRTFTITVDDDGVPEINFTVREVKITERGGSIKVRR